MDRAPDTSATSAWSRFDGLRAPSGANALAFAALFASSFVFLFVSYCLARALLGGFGAGVGAISACVAATAAASIFLWWLVPFADFGEIFWLHLPADRRAREGRCPHCGYPHESRATCTECGQPTAPLAAWTLSARPVKRLAWIIVPAIIFGSFAGEAWCRLDESRFVVESAAARTKRMVFTRPRAFPASFAKLSVDRDGRFDSAPWNEPGKQRDWQPADASRLERGLGWKERADSKATTGR
ncbi:MAG: hypothetical protein ACKO3W_02090 [bacterium]